jgi:large subunit ribosomal protein L6
MSRIGKKPIPLPNGVDLKLDGDILTVKGPKGSLQLKLHPSVKIKKDEENISVSMEGNGKNFKALHGLYRSLINNMVIGVSRGYEKTLEIVGVGYRADLSGRNIVFHLGYSNPINFPLPEGIEARVDRNKITLIGIDKQLVGMTAAKIRALRSPEPYKGKGVRYVDEQIRRKAGKSGAK